MAAVTYQALPDPLRDQLPTPEALSQVIRTDPEPQRSWRDASLSTRRSPLDETR